MFGGVTERLGPAGVSGNCRNVDTSEENTCPVAMSASVTAASRLRIVVSASVSSSHASTPWSVRPTPRISSKACTKSSIRAFSASENESITSLVNPVRAV